MTIYYSNDMELKIVYEFDATDKLSSEIADIVLGKINKYCTERNYTPPYIRMWNTSAITRIDVGSHTEFFDVVPEIDIGNTMVFMPITSTLDKMEN